MEEKKVTKRTRGLIVIDMVPGLVYGDGEPPVPGAADTIPYIQGELRYFRERDRFVVFVVTRREDGARDPIVGDLTPRSGEAVLEKPAMSAFFQTELEALLRGAGVGRVTLAGVGTATSILLTAADAYARGFGVSVPDPCVCDVDPDDAAYALRLIRHRWAPGGEGEYVETTSPAARIASSE